MRTSVKFFAGLVLGAMVLVPALANAGAVLDRIMSTKTMTLSSDAEYPPQSFLNDKNEMDGFDVAVAKEIARRLGVELKIVTPAWEIIVAGNWGKRWDISVGSMTPTKARAKVLDFPAVYYYTPAAFAVHKDSPIKSISGFNDKKIGVCGGCTYEGYLKKELVLDAGGVPPFEFQVTPGELRLYETDVNVFDDVKLGPGKRLDGALSALPTIMEAIKNGYPMRVVGKPVFYEPLAVAVDKGDPEWNAKLKSLIAAMRADGTLSKLSKKWYGVDYSSTK